MTLGIVKIVSRRVSWCGREVRNFTSNDNEVTCSKCIAQMRERRDLPSDGRKRGPTMTDLTGWVIVQSDGARTHVGRLVEPVDIDRRYCVLNDARCITYWGTERGVFQLQSGPTDKTRLSDACPRLPIIGVQTWFTTVDKWNE